MSSTPVEDPAVVDGPAGGGSDRGGAGCTGRRGSATSFVGSVLEDDGSVTILLRGRCDPETTVRLGEHIEAALVRGARFLTVEIVGPLAAGRAVYALLGRTQSRLAGRRGLLVVRGLRRGTAHAGVLDAGPR